MIQYRVSWSAWSNISFRGATDWTNWDDPDATPEEIEELMTKGSLNLPGLEEALNASGFEWSVETREVDHADQED